MDGGGAGYSNVFPLQGLYGVLANKLLPSTHGAGAFLAEKSEVGHRTADEPLTDRMSPLGKNRP